MWAIYSEIVAHTFGDSSNKCHQWKNIFSFAQSENLFKEYYDSDENEQYYYLTCTQRTDVLDLKLITNEFIARNEWRRCVLWKF